jgi:hypothetical protein
MSEEAAAATTEGDLWSLFFTKEMLRKIVDATNDKIEEEFLAKDYTDERMKKSPYIATTDEVFGVDFGFLSIKGQLHKIMLGMKRY